MPRDCLPPGAITPAKTRVLLAILRVHRRDGRATVRTVGTNIWLNPSEVHWHLRHLRDAGLVTWEPGLAGTLRPLVRPVPFGVKETTGG